MVRAGEGAKDRTPWRMRKWSQFSEARCKCRANVSPKRRARTTPFSLGLVNSGPCSKVAPQQIIVLFDTRNGFRKARKSNDSER